MNAVLLPLGDTNESGVNNTAVGKRIESFSPHEAK